MYAMSEEANDNEVDYVQKHPVSFPALEATRLGTRNDRSFLIHTLGLLNSGQMLLV